MSFYDGNTTKFFKCALMNTYCLHVCNPASKVILFPDFFSKYILFKYFFSNIKLFFSRCIISTISWRYKRQPAIPSLLKLNKVSWNKHFFPWSLNLKIFVMSFFFKFKFLDGWPPSSHRRHFQPWQWIWWCLSLWCCNIYPPQRKWYSTSYTLSLLPSNVQKKQTKTWMDFFEFYSALILSFMNKIVGFFWLTD